MMLKGRVGERPTSNQERSYNNMMLLVGEAWGEQEARQKRPFVGPSGYLLKQMLGDCGIYDYKLTNVFNQHPPNNDVGHFFITTPNRIHPYGASSMPIAARGKRFLSPAFGPELDRLYDEIEEWKPSVIVGLGNTALWALTGKFGIGAHRGCRFDTNHGTVYATWHPAAILRQYGLRTSATLDLLKAQRNEPLPTRTVCVLESPNELPVIEQNFQTAERIVACDIETTPDNQITSIGFAPTSYWAITIPIIVEGKSVWTLGEEQAIWKWVKRVLAEYKIVFQNGSFDMQHLWQTYGIPCPGFHGDTMLQHHSLQPEMPKSLGFLGSLYCNAPVWKTLRKHDDEEDDK